MRPSGGNAPDQICFTRWGPERHDLVRALNGIPASNLTDFAPEGYPGLGGAEECYAVVLDRPSATGTAAAPS